MPVFQLSLRLGTSVHTSVSTFDITDHLGQTMYNNLNLVRFISESAKSSQPTAVTGKIINTCVLK